MASSDMYHLKLTFFISITALPIISGFNYGFKFIDESVRPFWMMTSGFVLFGVIGAVTYFTSRVKDWIYFGMTLFAFTAVIDLVIPLEFLGLTESFMSEYLKLGEPYLMSPWGSAVCAFDGIGFYLMYLLFVYLYTNNRSWRSVGIYWGSALLNSMVILLSGIFIGKHSATFCTMLNVPYVLFPICVLFTLFKTQKRSGWNIKIRTSSLFWVIDAILAAGFLASSWIIVAKTHSLLGSTKQPIVDTVKAETALHYHDPAPFYTIQVFVFYFYVLPIQFISLYFLAKNEKPQFLWDAILVQAGIMIQAQFSYIVFSLDPKMPLGFRADPTNVEFWITNLLILIVPHSFLARLYLHRAQTKNVDKKKKGH